MNDLILVRVLECGTNLSSEFDDLRQIVCRLLAQVWTIDELHDEEREAVIFADVVDGNDVRMIQRRCGTRLAQEATARIGSSRYSCFLLLLLLLLHATAAR